MAMNHRLLRPRASGGGFDPRSIAGLEMYLNAKVASSITLNGSNVSEWRDLSGKGRHASQATAANQPAYGTGTWLGRPSVNFTRGSSHRLVLAPFALTTQTVFFVIEPTDSVPPGDASDIMYIATSTAGQGNRYTFTNITNYRTYTALLGGSVAAAAGTVGADLFAQEKMILSHSYNNSGSTTVGNHGLRKNRVGVTVQTNSLAGMSSNTARIGSRGDDTAIISANYAIILIYSRVLSADEIAAVENWAVSEYPLA